MGNVVIMFPLIELKTVRVWVNEESSESEPEVGGPWFTQFVTSCDCLLTLATPAGPLDLLALFCRSAWGSSGRAGTSALLGAWRCS